MYYKDKKLSFNYNMFKLYFNQYFYSIQAKVIFSIAIFFSIFIYLNFSSTNKIFDDEIILTNKMTNKKQASFIIDALIKPNYDDQEDKPIYTLVTPFINGIFIYNMKEPIESWWPFDCVRTRMKQSINTKLCIHDPKYDKYISAQLKENGLWEPTNVRTFMKQLKEIPDANVIDIGANIGLYSLLAAKLNRSVIAVEPLHENLSRMHKAAQLEDVQANIIGLVNALSNERKQIKLSILDYNIGGTYVVDKDLIDHDQKFQPTSSSVLVNSIIMDDLLDVIRVKLDKNISKKFIIKIDIEAYEPFVFENATQLFKRLEIPAIFMEFGKTVEKLKLIKNANSTASYLLKINNMIDMFKRLNYEPYEMNGYNKLDYAKWKNDWPWDVFFRQCDLVNCPEHTYKLTGV